MKTQMKLTYDKAELEIIEITTADILTTSGGSWGGALGGDDNSYDSNGWT